MKWINCIGVGLGLALMVCGCSVAKVSDSERPAEDQDETTQIDSLMAALSMIKAAELEATASQVALPSKLPFPGNPDLRQVYSEWFRKGYAYAVVTGSENLRDQVARSSDRERAKASGWFDGNSAGSLARRSGEIERTIGALTNQLTTPTQ